MIGRTLPLTIFIAISSILLSTGPSVARAEDGAAHVRYQRGFEIQSIDGDYRLRIRGNVQPRFAIAVDEDGIETIGFRVRQGRVALDGHVFHPRLRFFMQLETVAPRLLDYYLEVDLGCGVHLRAGQQRMPYSRQFLVSADALQFIDRSKIVGHFTADARIGPDQTNLVDRDVGVMASWTAASPILVRAGIFNGEGIGSTGTVDANLAYALRVDVTPLGRMPDEGVPQPQETRVNVGVSAVLNPQPAVGDAAQAQADLSLATGRLFATAEVHFRRYEIADAGIRDLGYFVQAGYLVLPNPAIEVAARYGRTELDLGSRNANEEITAGLGWYAFGHQAKLQLNYVLDRRIAEAATITGHAVVLQGQLGFR